MLQWLVRAPGEDCKGEEILALRLHFHYERSFCGARVGCFYERLVRAAAEGTMNSDFLSEVLRGSFGY